MIVSDPATMCDFLTGDGEMAQRIAGFDYLMLRRGERHSLSQA
ncbi:hypothetical protein [Sphingomonas sp.]